MHDTALRIGGLAIEIYCDPQSARILDVGSMDVNGSLRQFCESKAAYVGVDIETGPGVDVVVKPGAPIPLEDGSFDLVVATSALEHDAAFWMTFLEMCRKAKPGGYIYFNAPSNGAVHRFPNDHWRFYPDCGQALVAWALSQDIAVELVESFTAAREADIWNDFVAVFRRLPASRELPNRALHQEVSCFNVLTQASLDIINPRDETEDMALLRQAREAIEAQNLQLQDRESELSRVAEEAEAERRKRSEADEWVFRLSAERTDLQGEVRRLHQKVVSSERQLQRLKAQIAEAKVEGKMTAKALAAAEAEKTKLQFKLETISDKCEELEAALSARTAELTQAGEEGELLSLRLQERNRELGSLSLRILAAEREADRQAAAADWYERVSGLLTDPQPWWWALLPENKRQAKLEHRLLRHGLFDARSYLRRYPDVRGSGMSAICHYIRHGRAESRSWQ